MESSKTAHLTNFGILCVSGKDAVKFLQGYTTCDITRLDDRAALGAITNLQGRMLTSFIIVQQGGDLLLRMQRELVARTIEFLSKYIVFSKAEMSDLSDAWHCYGLPVPATSTPFSVSNNDTAITINLPWGQEIWSTNPLQADADINSWADAEVSHGIAWVHANTSETFLPQMFNYHNLNGIDFEKGCYLGQEVVARAQYRGELKRKLHRLDTAPAIEIGGELDGGEIVAVSGNAALAVLSNKTDEDIEVNLGGSQVSARLVSN